MTWTPFSCAVIFDLKEEYENDVALSYSQRRESVANLIAADRKCISLSYFFCHLVVSFCHFVMFSLSSCIEGKIRE